MFRGVYGSSRKHPDDIHCVLNRSWQQSIQKIIITIGTLNEADEALDLANTDGKCELLRIYDVILLKSIMMLITCAIS